MVSLVGVAILVGYISGRRSKPSVNTKGLADSERKALLEQMHAERKANQKVAEALQAAVAERKALATWYEASKEKLDDRARKEFERVAGDPAAVDKWLDGILSNNKTSKDPEGR